MASSNEKNFIAVPIIMFLEIVIMDGLTESGTFAQVIMMIYLVISCICLRKVVRVLNFLRGHPHFPFDQRQKEIQFEAMTRNQIKNYLENMDNDGVKAVGYEDIFDEKNDKFEKHN